MGIFYGASSFNSDLSKFDASSVKNMKCMFEYAYSFNSDLSKWDKITYPKVSHSTLPAYSHAIFCTICPPESGECLHGFKREDSVNCDVCPDGATDINNSCVPCPENPFLSLFLSFLALLILLIALLYFLRNTSFMQSIEFQTNLSNLIRTKQITAALAVLTLYATLSPIFPDWFSTLANIVSTIFMPFEVKPVCQSWYEDIDRGESYFSKVWMAFIFIYAVSFSLRYAYKLKRKDGELIFEISTLVNFQKLATLLMMQAPMIVLPLSFDPERLSANLDIVFEQTSEVEIAERADALWQAFLPSVLSFFLLVLISFFTIRRSSQSF
ncbi:hypothetical protein TL16_g09412 [Triparma laevis f. inornata]|uniref:Uncharacterized protein n=1 Tax=Triparma laevis f. inornata TaxID=1714386 RepID=A0A9W7EJ59_9STRA|nr:hypothetical protein TL16_g09412 [Triparma laevis f. inornata]